MDALRLHSASAMESLQALRTTGPYGRTGFHCAMQRGHADAVLAFGEQLPRFGFDEADLVALLAAHDQFGTPALHRAVFGEQHGSIRAFFAVIAGQSLASDTRLELLNARAGGIPGLAFAIAASDESTLRAYADGLVSLIDAFRSRAHSDGLSALKRRTPFGHRPVGSLTRLLAGLEIGDRDARVARGQLAARAGLLSGQDVLALITARDAQNRSALSRVRAQDRPNALATFKRVFDDYCTRLPGLDEPTVASLCAEANALDAPPGPMTFYGNPLASRW